MLSKKVTQTLRQCTSKTNKEIQDLIDIQLQNVMKWNHRKM